MKTAPLALLFTLTITASISAQVKPTSSAGGQSVSNSVPENPNSANATRARVLKPESQPNAQALQAHAKTQPTAARFRAGSAAPETNAPKAEIETARRPVALSSAGVNTLPAVSAAATQLYKVGPEDVLDIQIAGNPSRESTLFTILNGGLLDYPLAGAPIAAVGLTTSEIAALLRQRIKILENPNVLVSVRDYASHKVTVTGFVSSPGKKSLRREAVPLYAVLAEALVLPEAARATITRQGRPSIVADLKDPNHASTLIVAGDVIKVSGAAAPSTEFFYVGGAIGSPGQKPFHSGMTLTQAILASGGTTSKTAERIRVSRLPANGRLVTAWHNLRRVQDGKAEDPTLQKGDRIEVIDGN